MKLSVLFKEFFSSEKAGGLILLLATVFSLILANSVWSAEYISIWKYDLGGHSVGHWINDGLMAVFFLLIGLELEREINEGELSDIKNAALPIFAAAGGMLLPALFYTLFNYGTPAQSGVAIPMAKDIGQYQHCNRSGLAERSGSDQQPWYYCRTGYRKASGNLVVFPARYRTGNRRPSCGSEIQKYPCRWFSRGDWIYYVDFYNHPRI